MVQPCEKIGFFKTLWGCCCGTAIFKRLICHSWGRVIAHFVLLILLLSVIITAVNVNRARKETARITELLTAEFGKVIVTGYYGLYPSRSPEKNRTIALPRNGRLIYQPEISGEKSYTPEDLKIFRYLIFWTPHEQLIAVNQGELGWAAAGTRTGMKYSIVSASELLEMLTVPAEVQKATAADHYPAIPQPFSFWAKIFLFGLAIILFFGYFIGMTWTTLLYTGVFALMFRLTGGMKRLLSMTGSQFYKIGIYAGFPALLVAACFPVLNLPFLSFNTVYMIGLVTYWLIIVNRSEMEFRQNQGETQR